MSILAGFLIGIGDIALMSCDNKYVGAFLFSVALMSIIYFQLPLFTGRVGRMIRDRTYVECLRILIMNVVGATLAIWCYTLMTPDNHKNVITVANNKFNRGYLTLFIAGILCNVLIHVAVSAKQSVITILCVMTFILCGFEHSIADAGYIFVNWNYLMPWLVVVAGNTVGAILTFYLLEGGICNGKG